VLFNVMGGEDLGILEVYEAADIVSKAVDPEANIIVGATINPELGEGEVKVTLIATGFDMNKPNVHRSRSYPSTATGHNTTTQRRPDPIPAQPPQRPQQPQSPQSPSRSPSGFGGSDDLDIPPFLRNRNRGRQSAMRHAIVE
jgi:cell division protein FtsZ